MVNQFCFWKVFLFRREGSEFNLLVPLLHLFLLWELIGMFFVFFLVNKITSLFNEPIQNLLINNLNFLVLIEFSSLLGQPLNFCNNSVPFFLEHSDCILFDYVVSLLYSLLNILNEIVFKLFMIEWDISLWEFGGKHLLQAEQL